MAEWWLHCLEAELLNARSKTVITPDAFAVQHLPKQAPVYQIFKCLPGFHLTTLDKRTSLVSSNKCLRWSFMKRWSFLLWKNQWKETRQLESIGESGEVHGPTTVQTYFLSPAWGRRHFPLMQISSDSITSIIPWSWDYKMLEP